MKKQHDRKVIRDKVKEILEAEPALSEVPIFSNAAKFIQDDKLPSIYINSLSEEVRQLDEAPKRYIRQLDLILECYAAGTDEEDVQDLLDNLSLNCENVLGRNSFLNLEFVQDVDLVRVEFQFEPEGRKIIGAAKSTFRIEYISAPLARAEDDPTKCVSELAGTDVGWNTNQVNDADNPKEKIILEAEDKF